VEVPGRSQADIDGGQHKFKAHSPPDGVEVICRGLVEGGRIREWGRWGGERSGFGKKAPPMRGGRGGHPGGGKRGGEKKAEPIGGIERDRGGEGPPKTGGDSGTRIWGRPRAKGRPANRAGWGVRPEGECEAGKDGTELLAREAIPQLVARGHRLAKIREAGEPEHAPLWCGRKHTTSPRCKKVAARYREQTQPEPTPTRGEKGRHGYHRGLRERGLERGGPHAPPAPGKREEKNEG